MSNSTDPTSVRRHGVVLTCYVDGRKLFRAVRAEVPPVADGSGVLPVRSASRRRPGGHS
ncbi:MAG: hypothetical protein U1A27_09915 [Phycisphaerae bacterium]